MKMIRLIIMVAALASAAFATDDVAICVGPMIHWNIGNQVKNRFSITLETSVWYWEINSVTKHYGLPSIDAGIEYEFALWSKQKSEPNRWLMYSELQHAAIPGGYFLAGYSIGVVRDISNGSTGLQGSIWANMFGGVNLRYRRLYGANQFCPGIYGKFPFFWSDDEFMQFRL